MAKTCHTLASIRHLLLRYPRPAPAWADRVQCPGAMIWSLFQRGGWMSPGERARRMHERWLNEAVRSGRSYPRIPARRVDLGGMEPLMDSRRGREWARRWWERVLDRADLS